jgi:hypothetical protein
VSDLLALWVIAAGLAAAAVFSAVVGGWLGWSVAAVYGYFAVDLVRFALRLRRLRVEADRELF